MRELCALHLFGIPGGGAHTSAFVCGVLSVLQCFQGQDPSGSGLGRKLYRRLFPISGDWFAVLAGCSCDHDTCHFGCRDLGYLVGWLSGDIVEIEFFDLLGDVSLRRYASLLSEGVVDEAFPS